MFFGKDSKIPSKLAGMVASMNGSDFKDRFCIEYLQITIRLSKLEKMLCEMKAGTLNFTPKCSYELLHEQAVYMEQYKRVLEERAKIEGIDLGSDA